MPRPGAAPGALHPRAYGRPCRDDRVRPASLAVSPLGSALHRRPGLRHQRALAGPGPPVPPWQGASTGCDPHGLAPGDHSPRRPRRKSDVEPPGAGRPSVLDDGEKLIEVGYRHNPADMAKDGGSAPRSPRCEAGFPARLGGRRIGSAVVPSVGRLPAILGRPRPAAAASVALLHPGVLGGEFHPCRDVELGEDPAQAAVDGEA